MIKDSPWLSGLMAAAEDKHRIGSLPYWLVAGPECPGHTEKWALHLQPDGPAR